MSGQGRYSAARASKNVQKKSSGITENCKKFYNKSCQKKSSETILKYMKQCPYKSIFPKKNLNKVQWGKNQEKGKKYCQEKCTNIALATFKMTRNSAQKSSLR